MSTNSLKTNDAIIRALDVLNFDAGDWNPEHIERHLREQIELAKEILNTAAEQPVQHCWEGGTKETCDCPDCGSSLIDYNGE